MRRGTTRSSARAKRSLSELVARLPPAARDVRLEDLPGLGVRVRKALQQEGLTTIASLAERSDQELLGRRNFGTTSMANLCDAILRVALEFGGIAPVGPHDAPADGSVARIVRSLPAEARRLALEDLEGLAPRTRHGLRRCSLVRVGDLELTPDSALLRQPGFGSVSLLDLKRGLQDLALALAAESSGTKAPEDLLRDALLRASFLDAIEARLAETRDARSARILARQFAISDPGTLDSLGREYGVTRERIRQVRNRAVRAIVGNGRLVELVDERLARARAGRHEPLTWAALEGADPWFAGVSERSAWAGALLAALGCSHRILPDAMEEILAPADVGSLQALADEFLAFYQRQPQAVAREAAAAEFARSRGVLDLLSPLLERTARAVRVNGQVIASPSHAQRVNWILERSAGPRTVREIVESLEAEGHPIGERAVRVALDRLDVLNTAPSTYVHRALLSRWDALSPQVRRDVVPLFEEDCDRQWSSLDLLDEMRRRGAAWATRIEDAYVLEHMLLQVPELEDLGRRLWGLRGRHAHRASVGEIAQRILVDAGGPLASRELMDRIRRERSLGPTLTLRWPLVLTGDGRVGLSERDLGWTDDEFGHLTRQVTAELAAGSGRIDPQRLEQLRDECCPSLRERSLSVAASAIAANQPDLRLDAGGRGLRRADVAPLGADKTTWSQLPPARRDLGALGALSAGKILDWLERVEDGQPTDALLRRLEADLRVRLPEEGLRRWLLAARWTQRRGRWHAPDRGQTDPGAGAR